MKQYDFDEVIDRKGSNAVKYDSLGVNYGKENLIPLWVADMDFRTPDFILDALRKRLDHPILGYPILPDSYIHSIIEWLSYKHNWSVQPEWLTYIPGIVKGIGLVLQVFTNPGDKVIIQPPVYHPFRLVPEHNGREIINNPLIEDNECYRIDFENLEQLLPDAKLLILCNPHNPGGIVWDKDSLIRVARLCAQYDVLVISDEIHSDMIHKGYLHVPFASVSQEAAENSITFMAPSKTFNIAGIVSSFAIVPDSKIRRTFFDYLSANEFSDASIFSVVATEAAYRGGKEWLEQMMDYVEENARYVQSYLHTHIPLVTTNIPQASFLMWLDCRNLNLSQEELVALFVDKAGLALNDGAMFGPGGIGFMRMNIGCPRSILEKGLTQLKLAIYE